MARLPDGMLPDGMARGARGYIPRVAAFLADCAALAYADREAVAAALGQAAEGGDRLDWVEVFSAEGTQGYVAGFRACIVVAFRGTERDYRDILTDLDFWPDPVEAVEGMGGRVHGGFLAALNAVRGDIRKAIVRDGLATPVYFTGHSLGGALAVLAAAACAGSLTLMDRRFAVYTYGAPRVGDRAFVQAMRDFAHVPVYRHTNTADIVPWVPPFTLCFRHGGAHIHLSEDGRVLRAPGLARYLGSMVTALIPDLLRARHWTGMLPLRLFTDHAIDAYRRKLRARADG